MTIKLTKKEVDALSTAVDTGFDRLEHYEEFSVVDNLRSAWIKVRADIEETE